MEFTHSLFIRCRVNMRFIHKCDVCDKEFTRKGSLRYHEKIQRIKADTYRLCLYFYVLCQTCQKGNFI